MQDKDTRAWLALHRTAHLNASALRRLMAATSCPQEILQLSPATFNALKISPATQQAIKHYSEPPQVEIDYACLQEQQIQLLPINSDLYPELLKQISDPPPLLYVRGNARLLNQPQLAMVGSRHASRQGCENAFCFARELAGLGFVVTSGLALGIDTQSHQGALASSGHTVAVMGTGIDVVYPARNRQLFDDICARGVVISEFPLATGPRRHLFPKRNRLISGLSLGVLVVEAALKSGSLITARCALEQDREVFAIPGSIHNPGSKGCHNLIRQGAKLVETTQDVMEELKGWMTTLNNTNGEDKQPVANAEFKDISTVEQQLMDLLGFDPAPIDLIQQRSGWPLATLMSVLTTLELKGAIENHMGCYQRRVVGSLPVR
jgi:DNA processing protein